MTFALYQPDTRLLFAPTAFKNVSTFPRLEAGGPEAWPFAGPLQRTTMPPTESYPVMLGTA